MRKARAALFGAVLALGWINGVVYHGGRLSTPDPPAQTRPEALGTLGVRRSEQATRPDLDPVRALIRQLQTGDRLARQEAAEELGKLGPAAREAIPALKEVSARDHFSRAGGDALASIEKTDPYPEPPPLNPFSAGGIEWIAQQNRLRRWEIIDGKRTPEQPSVLALPALIRSLNGAAWEDRLIAAEALAQLGPLARPALDPLLVALEDEWPLEPPTPPPSPFGLGYSSLGSRVYGVRAAAVKALLAIGPAAEGRLRREGLPRLISGLQRGTFYTRLHTAVAVGMLKARSVGAIPALVELLHVNYNGEGNGTHPFADALFAIGPSAVPAVISLLRTETDWVQERGLELLARFGGQARSAVPVVLPLLDHSSRYLRGAAARTLTHLDVSAAVTHLPRLLMDENEEVADQAAQLLRRIGPRARPALPALTRAMNQRNDQVAGSAALAILRIEGPNEELISRMGKLRERGTPAWWTDRVLAKVGTRAPRVVATPAQRLGDEKEEIPTGPEAVRNLTSLLWHIEDNKRLAAINELARLGPAAEIAVPRLRRLLEDDDETFQIEASLALLRIRGEEPSPHLFRRALCFPPVHLHQWRSTPYQVAIRRLGQLAVDREWAKNMLIDEWKRSSSENRKVILKHLEDARSLGVTAIPDILAFVKDEMRESPYWDWTEAVFPQSLRAFAAFGPAAKDALPLLRCALLKADSGMVDQIERTVDAIEGVDQRVK